MATLSSKSVNDLLKLCTTKQNNGTFDYELVIIAFNYGGEITTEEGKKLFEEYVKKYGEYKSETTSIRISPTLGSTSVANPGPILGPILGPPSSASSSSSLSVANPGPILGPPSSSSPSSPSSAIMISTPVTVPDPPSGPLLKELLDAKDVYIPVLTPSEVIYIKVTFKDNIPENIEIEPTLPTTTTVEPNLKTYIEEICNGTKSVPDDTVVYFKFDQTELDNLLGLIA